MNNTEKLNDDISGSPDPVTINIIPASATSKVLNTYELLENVLIYLDKIFLLTRARLVSKKWSGILNSSPTLRWKTWRWDKSMIPLPVRQDREFYFPPKYGVPGSFNFEFASWIVPGIQKFWMSISHIPKTHWGSLYRRAAIYDLPMIAFLPDVELCRPLHPEGYNIFMCYKPSRYYSRYKCVSVPKSSLRLSDVLNTLIEHIFLDDQVPVSDFQVLGTVQVWVALNVGTDIKMGVKLHHFKLGRYAS